MRFDPRPRIQAEHPTHPRGELLLSRFSGRRKRCARLGFPFTLYTGNREARWPQRTRASNKRGPKPPNALRYSIWWESALMISRGELPTNDSRGLLLEARQAQSKSRQCSPMEAYWKYLMHHKKKSISPFLCKKRPIRVVFPAEGISRATSCIPPRFRDRFTLAQRPGRSSHHRFPVQVHSLDFR